MDRYEAEVEISELIGGTTKLEREYKALTHLENAIVDINAFTRLKTEINGIEKADIYIIRNGNKSRKIRHMEIS